MEKGEAIKAKENELFDLIVKAGKKLLASKPSSSEPTAGKCQHIATFTATGRPVCMKCGKVFEEAE